MSRPIAIRGDLSHLPDYAFGSASLGWWGVIGFMLIEGMAFVLAAGTYLYLIPFEQRWPPASPPPDLIYGTLLTLVLALSLIPNAQLTRAAKREDLSAVRRGMLILIVFGIAALVLRGLEFTRLNDRWDSTAYGSILWAILFIHTTHLATDFYDTLPLAVLMHDDAKVDGRHFADVSDNALYWNFVVLSWSAIYVLIYWLPRWLQ